MMRKKLTKIRLKNDGFTLVEVIGVITLLIVMALVTYPGLIKTIKENKEASYDSKVKDIIIAAKTYNSLNGNNYTQIALSELISEKYIDKMINPNNNNEMNGCIYVENNEYRYEEVSCSSSIDKEICNYDIGQIWNFDYTGGEQVFVVPCTGTYKLETWGAQGGGITVKVLNDYPFKVVEGGYGGYSIGNSKFVQNQNIYINIGGAGTNNCYTDCNGGYNGGGNSLGLDGLVGTGSGGGATHIAMDSGILSSLSQYAQNNNSPILIVSGGGGGSGNGKDSLGSGTLVFGYGGSAGGFKGNLGYDEWGEYLNGNGYSGHMAIGGTQVEAGYSIITKDNGLGSFGRGGNLYDHCCGGNGGGSGYYGGGGSTRGHGGAGGGSSYIANTSLKDKAMYCYDCEESGVESILTISTTGTSELRDTTACPDGYSNNPIAKCAKAGNGYARITLISYN